MLAGRTGSPGRLFSPRGRRPPLDGPV